MFTLFRYLFVGLFFIAGGYGLIQAFKEDFKKIKEDHAASVIADYKMMKRSEKEKRERKVIINLIEEKEIAKYIGKRLKKWGYMFNPQDYWEVYGGYRDETGLELNKVYVGPAYKKIFGFWQRKNLVSIYPNIICRINERLYWWKCKDRIE